MLTVSCVVEGEAVADFVAGGGGLEEALVEKELAGGEGGEGGLGGEAGLEAGEGGLIAGAAFAAGESDVGMEGARVGLEAAGDEGGGEVLLEGEERGRDLDAGEENSGAGEGGEGFKLDGDLRGVDGGEAGDEGLVLLRGGCAEEGEGDVPGVGGGPAEGIVFAAEAGGEGGELGHECGRERDGDEEAHTGVV